ncbi:MAG: hypothetical protein LBL77_01230 [Endomicrobium sp.]|nr:hypothetical protein [Endomicrobium sp.]
MLIIVVILLGISILAVVFCLVITLVQIKRATKEFELVMRKINNELGFVTKLSDKVASIIEKFSSPIISFVSLLFCIISNINKRKKRMPGGNK